MIVFIAGMQRSGSTFAFNVARDVLRRRGTLHQAAATDTLAQLIAAGDARHILLKAHEMDDTAIRLARAGAIRVICTTRRPEDAAASFIQTFGLDEDVAIALVRGWIGMYAQVRRVALTIDYDTIDLRPLWAARTIGRFLYPDVGWREAYRIARDHSKWRVKAASDRLAISDPDVIDLGYSYYDRRTFFHRRHVSSLTSQSAGDRLPADQAARLRNAFDDAS